MEIMRELKPAFVSEKNYKVCISLKTAMSQKINTGKNL